VNAWMVVEEVVGGIYSPNHQFNCWGRLSVDGHTGQSGA
jgi:hypothetical protein